MSSHRSEHIHETVTYFAGTQELIEVRLPTEAALRVLISALGHGVTSSSFEIDRGFHKALSAGEVRAVAEQLDRIYVDLEYDDEVEECAFYVIQILPGNLTKLGS